MSTLELGKAPDDLKIIITPGMPWEGSVVATLNKAPWVWPIGTTLTLVTNSQSGDLLSFVAVLDEANATWTLAAEDTGSIADLTHSHIDVQYPGKTPFRWASGKVVHRS